MKIVRKNAVLRALLGSVGISVLRDSVAPISKTPPEPKNKHNKVSQKKRRLNDRRANKFNKGGQRFAKK